MKNKRAQAEIWAVILAAVGALSAWVMAARMDYGIIAKIFITIATFAVCFFMVRAIGNA